MRNEKVWVNKAQSKYFVKCKWTCEKKSWERAKTRVIETPYKTLTNKPEKQSYKKNHQCKMLKQNDQHVKVIIVEWIYTWASFET